MNAFSHQRELVIHASAVRTGKGALLFLGPSGTGKSTICQLLSDRAPQLANDAVYLLHREDGRWGAADGGRRAYDGPLTAEEIATLRTVPLRAVLRLFQGAMVYLQPIGKLETCRYLTDALFEIGWQRDYDVTTKRELFSRLAAVSRSVSGYEFHFDRSPRTLDTLNAGIGL